MRETVALAREHGVAVGLHNGYGDLVGFGRREIKAAPEELRDELIYQLGALREFARLYGLEVQHVKPHGALYMAAARDEELSRAIIGAIQESDPALVLYCMQSSKTHEIAQEMIPWLSSGLQELGEGEKWLRGAIENTPREPEGAPSMPFARMPSITFGTTASNPSST